MLPLVTTRMLALVALLILNFGFGFAPRIIAVALAAGPMVMINAATGFQWADTMTVAVVRSCQASTLQIFTKIRTSMAMPSVMVGLMFGVIFGMITAVGAEMPGGGVVITSILGGALLTPGAAEAKPCTALFSWISPRGTIEVMDDYPH